MSNETQLARANSNGTDGAVASLDGNGRSADPYRVAQRALRGRYGTIVILGLIGAVVGGWAGWKLGKPIYQSEGLIQIAYSKPRISIADEGERYRPWESFQAVVNSEQARLSSRPLVDLAMQEPAWQATGRSASPAVIQGFAEGLKVEHRPHTDYLRITYRDSDPQAAAAGVRALIDAYERVYDSQENQRSSQKIAAMESREAALQERLALLQKQNLALSEELASGTAEPLLDSATDRMRKVESVLTDVQLALILAKENRGLMTLSQIAMVDPTMREHITRRDEAADGLSRLKRLGYGEEHRSVAEAREAVARWDERIDQYAHEYRTIQPTLPPVAGAATEGPLALVNRSPDELREDAKGVLALWEEVRQDVVTLGAKRVQVDKLQAEILGVNEELAAVRRQIDDLRADSVVGGRLNIISRGETPIAPVVDERVRYAAAGGLAGLFLPASFFILLGLIGRSYRYSNEMEDELPQMPLLGILPQLPNRLNDPARIADAAQCLHHIRVMLQVNGPSGSRPVYLVTSASAGEGKTSLVAALGLSFAASGSRTLLVDCDLVGQWLTHGFMAEDCTGLHEAMSEGNLKEHVQDTSSPNLFILPVGQADLRHANTISSRSLSKLLAEARKRFDVVLIDSGPVLGSVETGALAPHVDGTVLVIARHQQRPAVDRAVRQLQSVGAKLTGTIFNRAEQRDVYRSVSCSSTRTVRIRPVERVVSGGQTSRFGPLVRSVACLLPEREEREDLESERVGG